MPSRPSEDAGWDFRVYGLVHLLQEGIFHAVGGEGAQWVRFASPQLAPTAPATTGAQGAQDTNPHGVGRGSGGGGVGEWVKFLPFWGYF